MNVYLLKYNLYSNRIYKRENTLHDYLSRAEFTAGPLGLTNFNPGDGVTTSHIFNKPEEFVPDYLLIVNDANEIVSRWFIINGVRTSGNQYRYSLLNDCLADNERTVLGSPCFIEKGFVENSNPLIYNKEDFVCNQIPKQLDLLYDNTHCSWLVAYFNSTKKADLSGSITTLTEPYINTGAATIGDWSIMQKYHTNGYPKKQWTKFDVDIDQAGTTDEMRVWFNPDVEAAGFEYFTSKDTTLEFDSGTPWAWEREERTYNATKAAIRSNKHQIETRLLAWNTPEDAFEDVKYYDGKIVKTNDNKFYRIHVVPGGVPITQARFLDENNATDTQLLDALERAFKPGGVWSVGWSGGFEEAFYIQWQVQIYDVYYDDITNDAVAYNYNFTTVHELKDEPWGMIAFPYKTINEGDSIIATDNINKDLALEILRDMAKDGVGAEHKLFDIQILPYCPIVQLEPNIIEGHWGDVINFTTTLSLLDSGDVVYIKDSSNHVRTFALICTTSKFTLNIPYIKAIQNVKIENQTQYCELYSPCGLPGFEFVPARNEGISYFNVDCTYKPYQPYIHLNPDFKGLYGQDFDDNRGLICKGDFSVSVIGSAWENYKLQNNNYAEIFNRQIQNMDVSNEIALKEQAWSTAGGALTGAAAGGAAGSMVASPIGGAVGAIGGAAASTLGGIADRAIMKERQKEAKSYAIDMHNYNLQNIRNRPDTLSKVDAYTNNNKIWPYIITYDCSDKEKEIFELKLMYDGMTVGAIGTIEDYLNPNGTTFIRGQMIRFNDIEGDVHTSNEIYNRIKEGVYM